MDNKALIEAAIFVSEKPLSVRRLAELTGLTEKEVTLLVLDMQKETKKLDRGIELVSTPEGYEFRLKPEYRDKVSSFAPFSDMSEGVLRTLAIVAARQPVKQSVIVTYQGNKAYGYIEKLEKKGLVVAEKAGRTRLIRTTSDFEKYFGRSTEDIKRLLASEKQQRREENRAQNVEESD
jgi:segregation and condensation protein B